MKRKVCATAIVFLVISSCGTHFIRAGTKLGIALEEVLSIGRLDDDALFMWAGVATDETGNIYVTDTMDYSLKKFSSQGKLITKAGGRGQGPGEFLAPRLLGASSQFLYATDQSIPGIQVFDRKLKFQHRIAYDWPISDLKVLADASLAVIPVSFDSSGWIDFLSRKGEVLKRVKYCSERGEMLLNLANVEFGSQGDIYLAYCFQDRIERIDESGRILWSNSLLKVKKIEKTKVKNFAVPSKITYKSVAMDRQKYLYVLGGHYSQNRSRDVYVLNRGGEHLATFTLPETSHCIHIDGQDYLYSRANDGATLKKYRIRFIPE